MLMVSLAKLNETINKDLESLSLSPRMMLIHRTCKSTIWADFWLFLRDYGWILAGFNLDLCGKVESHLPTLQNTQMKGRSCLPLSGTSVHLLVAIRSFIL